MDDNDGGLRGLEGDEPYYVVFRRGTLIELTTSSEVAVKKFLYGTPDGTPADGMYKIHTLKELEALIEKERV